MQHNGRKSQWHSRLQSIYYIKVSRTGSALAPGWLDASGKLVGADIEAQTSQALANVRDVLREAGCSLDQVVKSTVWLTQREDFARFNAVYASHFPVAPPVRSTVVSGLVLPGALVEIEVVAYAP